MIGQVLSLGSFFLDIAKQLYPESKDIASAAQVTDRAKHSYNVISTSSVQRSAARTILNPMVAIEGTLIHQEYTPDLMTVVTLRDITATLTHLALQNSVEVGVKVENLIGSISPNRGGMMSLFSGLEAMDNNIKPKDPATPNQVQVNSKTYSELMEFTPLAVGKVVNTTLYGANGNKIEVPLTIRQIPIPVTHENLVTLFSAAKPDEGLKMRWIMKKSGEITTPQWFDGSDIVKARFKAKMGDTSGYYKEAMKRDTQNKLEAIRTGIISMNSMANTVIITQDTATQLELEIGRKFADPVSREKIFESISANTLVIVNDDRGIFTFYTDGQTMPEVYTRRDLSVKSKKEGSANTLQDLVKLLNGGL